MKNIKKNKIYLNYRWNFNRKKKEKYSKLKIKLQEETLWFFSFFSMHIFYFFNQFIFFPTLSPTRRSFYCLFLFRDIIFLSTCVLNNFLLLSIFCFYFFFVFCFYYLLLNFDFVQRCEICMELIIVTFYIISLFS